MPSCFVHLGPKFVFSGARVPVKTSELNFLTYSASSTTVASEDSSSMQRQSQIIPASSVPTEVWQRMAMPVDRRSRTFLNAWVSVYRVWSHPFCLCSVFDCSQRARVCHMGQV